MSRILPLILGLVLFVNALPAETVAGIDLTTLKRPEGLALNAEEVTVERREQGRIREGLKLIESGEYDAKRKDGYSKLRDETIDNSHVREAGEQKIAKGEDMLKLAEENLGLLYEEVEKRRGTMSEAADTGLLREWTNLDGRSLTALFIALDGDKLTLQAETGQEYVVPLSMLVEGDHAAAKLMDDGKTLTNEDFLETIELGGVSEMERFYEAGYVPDGKTQGDALTLAVKRSRVLTPMLQKLIEKGIDPNQTNSEGLTALSVAAAAGAQESAKFLLESGASSTMGDATGEELTPLLWAIHKGDAAMTTLLASRSEGLSENVLSLVQLAEAEQLKPIELDMLQQLRAIDNGTGISLQDELAFRLKLFGLEPTMAGLEKCVITRSFRPYVVNYHGYDFYKYTLDRNEEFMDENIKVWKALRDKSVGATYSLALAQLYGWIGYKDTEMAIENLQQGAKKDHPPSMVLLGELYEEGIYIEKNPYEAFNNYRKAAEIGDPIGMAKLGHCYEIGLHVDKDVDKAFNWYERATDTGSTEGMAQMGRCYMEGISVKANLKTGLDWYTKAAEANNLSAMNFLGEAMLQGRGQRSSNTSAGVSWLQRAAEFGDRSALLKLGFVYSDGTLREDQSLASKYFLEAAERDETEAMYQIARRLATGNGVQKDPNAAFKWYETAAARGHLDAENQVAVAYSSGVGVAQDEKKAFSIFKKVAAQGHMEANANLAVCYARGLGTTIDEQESSRLYLEVVNSSNATAKAIVKVLTQEQD